MVAPGNGSKTSRSWSNAWRLSALFAVVVALLFLLPPGAAAQSVGTPGAFLAAHPAPHAASLARAHPSLAPHPGFSNPPTISYFYAAPSSFPQTSSTTFYSYVYGATPPYTYLYSNLPAGCTSANTSLLSCTPTVNGSFTVKLTVSDVNGNTSYANASIVVWPYETGPFLGLTQHFADTPHAQQPCRVINAKPFYTSYCYQELESPNVLAFANGAIGLVYSTSTTSSTTSCTGAASATVSRLGLSMSTDGGVSFSTPVTFGNDSCAYLNAIEPSFAVSGTGTSYGVFVEENASVLPGAYAGRATDALGFTSSSNNGASWATATTLVSSGNIARPELAVLGRTIYVVYEDIATQSTPIGGGVLPMAVEFLASTDGGATWSVPTALPGLNATQFDSAMGASIAVAQNGTVGVAYATNRTCVDATATGGCYTWGDQVVVVTSSNNGTTWTGPSVVASNVGETSCAVGTCTSSFYQSEPSTAIAFNATGALYVAFAGGYHTAGRVGSKDYRASGLFLATSSWYGGSWTQLTVAKGEPGAIENYSTPTLATSPSGVVNLVYLGQNGTPGSGAYSESYQEWYTHTTGGSLPLSEPLVIQLDRMPQGLTTNATQGSFVGYTGSIAFNQTGQILSAFVVPEPPAFSTSSSPTYYYANYTYSTNLSLAQVAVAGSALTVGVTFQTSGLPTGQKWGVIVDGVLFTTTSTGLYLANVPAGVEMTVVAYNSSVSAWGTIQIEPPTLTISDPYTFSYPQTVTVEFQLVFALVLGFNPNYPPNTYAEWYISAYYCPPGAPYGCFSIYGYHEVDSFYVNAQLGTYQFNYTYWSSTFGYKYIDCYGYTKGLKYCYGGNFSTYSLQKLFPFEPFYLPYGTTLYPYIYAGNAVTYVNGTGPGSYTGSPTKPCMYCGYSAGPITMDGPINETAWVGAGATSGSNVAYNETVSAYGLPTATPYHFTWNGTTYNGTTPGKVTVYNQLAGGYAVTNIWAAGATAGWQYFGQTSPSGDVIVPYQPTVNLTFTSYEDLAVAPHAVSFHALNLSAGTNWQLTFNGTTYASSSPWINLTVHPGSYDVNVPPATSADGSVTYAALSFGSQVTISASETMVNVSFTPVYKLVATASAGGTFALNGGPAQTSATVLAAPGTTETLVATPSTGWSFVDWTGTGSGSYTGASATATVTLSGGVTESAAFSPLPDARFNLTFVENSLPSGTWWTVSLKGVAYSSNTNTITVPNLYAWPTALGKYPLSVPYAYLNSTSTVRYSATYPGLVGTNGTGTLPVPVTFQPQFLVNAYSSAGGSAVLEENSIPIGGTAWGSTGNQYQLVATANPGHTFMGWTGTGSGSYTGLQATPTITVGGSPITEVAQFATSVAPPPKEYSVTVKLATPLEAGTGWSVVLSKTGTTLSLSSTGSTLVASDLLAGTYSLVLNPTKSPDGLTEYTAAATNVATVNVNQNQTVTVSYQTWYYVSITGSPGGSVGPQSSFVLAGSTVDLLAQPTGTDTFAGWLGTGNGAYTGSSSAKTITVNGPITEVAQFVPPTPSTVKSTQSTSMWENPAVLAGLAAVGLIVGLLVGILAFRRRGGGGASSAPPAAVSGTEASEGPGDAGSEPSATGGGSA
jgi:hypothetical protein